jgi:hypothetical protein
MRSSTWGVSQPSFCVHTCTHSSSTRARPSRLRALQQAPLPSPLALVRPPTRPAAAPLLAARRPPSSSTCTATWAACAAWRTPSTAAAWRCPRVRPGRARQRAHRHARARRPCAAAAKPGFPRRSGCIAAASTPRCHRRRRDGGLRVRLLRGGAVAPYLAGGAAAGEGGRPRGLWLRTVSLCACGRMRRGRPPRGTALPPPNTDRRSTQQEAQCSAAQRSSAQHSTSCCRQSYASSGWPRPPLRPALLRSRRSLRAWCAPRSCCRAGARWPCRGGPSRSCRASRTDGGRRRSGGCGGAVGGGGGRPLRPALL